MTKAKTTNDSKSSRKVKPALTPDAREKQMVSLAVDLAERQLIEGTASSQVITHYLKLGTKNHELEIEKLQEENKLLRAKTETLQSAQKTEELYREAMAAMRAYSGNGDF